MCNLTTQIHWLINQLQPIPKLLRVVISIVVHILILYAVLQHKLPLQTLITLVD